MSQEENKNIMNEQSQEIKLTQELRNNRSKKKRTLKSIFVPLIILLFASAVIVGIVFSINLANKKEI